MVSDKLSEMVSDKLSILKVTPFLIFKKSVKFQKTNNNNFGYFLFSISA